MGMRGISMYEQPPDVIPPYHLPPVSMQVPQGKPRHRMRNCIMIVGVLLLGLIVVLLLLVLFVSRAQNSTPYPWNVTIHSGYTRETTLYGVPVGGTKYAQLHATLFNVSGDTLSPNDLIWTLTDTNTNENYTGTMEGNVPALMLPGQSSDLSLDFQVPIASDVFTLNLSGPAGPDPTTWPVHFSF
jgi:hypothetical protein